VLDLAVGHGQAAFLEVASGSCRRGRWCTVADRDHEGQAGGAVAIAMQISTVTAAPLPMIVQNSGQKSDAKFSIVLASFFPFL
jgi:hypothetical protein